MSTSYISETGRKAVLQYKYVGCDNSLYYKYVLTPMNKIIINFIPKCIAPNVLTIVGLFFTISAFMITSYYSPHFDKELPRWVPFYVAMSLFVYQTLDNLDGGQARRTNSSSPLGMLFDHGVDAINIVLGPMNMTSVLRAGSGLPFFLVWPCASVSPFFFATWDEYYTDELNLAIINGPSDGILLSMILCCLVGAGKYVTRESVRFNFPFLELVGLPDAVLNMDSTTSLFMILAFGAVVTCSHNAFNVIRHQKKIGKSKLELLGPFYRAVPYLMHVFLIALEIFHSPSNIYIEQPRLFVLAHGFVFCYYVCRLMLCHICGQKYVPVEMSQFLLLPYLFTYNCYSKFVPDTAALGIMLMCAFWLWIHLSVSVIREMTDILGIYCFFLGKRVTKVVKDSTVNDSSDCKKSK
eukprot:212575_1